MYTLFNIELNKSFEWWYEKIGLHCIVIQNKKKTLASYLFCMCSKILLLVMFILNMSIGYALCGFEGLFPEVVTDLCISE